MTDENEIPPDSEREESGDVGAVSPDSAGDDAEASAKDSTEQEVPPGMLPLVPPVFGKRAFWICAVPFVLYLAGTSIGTYLENVRKTLPLHDMRGLTKLQAQYLKHQIQASPTQASELLERLDPDGVITAMEDENSDFHGLVEQCTTLLQDDLQDLPEPISESAKSAKAYLSHFLRLEEMVEEGEEGKILEEHEAFVIAQNDPEKIPQLRVSWYPVSYSIACIVSFLAVVIALPGYFKIPFRISGIAIGVGVAGIFVWLGLWWLDKNFLHIGEFFGAHSRAGFNPWRELKDNPTWMYAFVGIRILGLCLVIPIAEEFFARGFLMRYIEDIDWDQIPMGEATWKGWAGILVYGAMTHPGEVVAALAWFGMMTWMYLKTKNVWDCVIAHAITNALLAAFVLRTNIWELW